MNTPNEHAYTSAQAKEKIAIILGELKRLAQDHGVWCTLAAFHEFVLGDPDVGKKHLELTMLLAEAAFKRMPDLCPCPTCAAKRGQA